MATPAPTPIKSKRVRTGCLTCRERHLKCDEGTPDCLNCQKSNRECKRGVRLNFIDLTCKQPPFIPPVEEWSVQFQDESRLIASEYRGGLARYPKLRQGITPSRDADRDVLRSLSVAASNPETKSPEERKTSIAITTPQALYYDDRRPSYADNYKDVVDSRKNSNASLIDSRGPSQPAQYGDLMNDSFLATTNEGNLGTRQINQKDSDSTGESVAGLTAAGQSTAFRGNRRPESHQDEQNQGVGIHLGVSSPSNDGAQEREYLNSPEELLFMQVFVSEVGVWMDNLDRDKHFSRIVPYQALECPMLLNALLACGVKHLTLTQQYQYNDDKALYYYDTATTQLLRSLQNPERDMAECATTAVVLNMYEIMSEKPTHRMSHIAGARALIRECGWNGRSGGLGSACFWLNVCMELLSCMAHNWKTTWDPSNWGVDMDFARAEESRKKNKDRERNDPQVDSEEVWVHRIFHITAKICNFRASESVFQDSNPHDQQIRIQSRFAEWQQLKDLCDQWNNACPRPMHPLGYLYPPHAQASGGSSDAPESLFPNIWLIRRAAVTGRLFYHTAQCLLAQSNPIISRNSDEALAVQQHHARQVCGIVAHTRDRGVASVSIQSLAIVAEVLTSIPQRREVLSILDRIQRESGWRLSSIVHQLKGKWGWEQTCSTSSGSGGDRGIGSRSGIAIQFLAGGPGRSDICSSPAVQIMPELTSTSAHGRNNTAPASALTPAPTQTQINPHASAHQHMQAQTQMHSQPTTLTSPQVQLNPQPQSSTAVATPRPLRNMNPLRFADFSHPNHPYRNFYEPPSRSNSYTPSSHEF